MSTELQIAPKELSLCLKLWFSNLTSLQLAVVDLRWTMNSVRSNNLKYQTFAPWGCKDIGIRNFEFVTKIQFLNGCTFNLQGYQLNL